MNWEQVEGKWDQVKGDIKSKWGKLTDDDLMDVRGKREKLVGKLQEKYGELKDAAEKKVDEYIAAL